MAHSSFLLHFACARLACVHARLGRGRWMRTLEDGGFAKLNGRKLAGGRGRQAGEGRCDRALPAVCRCFGIPHRKPLCRAPSSLCPRVSLHAGFPLVLFIESHFLSSLLPIFVFFCECRLEESKFNFLSRVSTFVCFNVSKMPVIN